MRRLSEEWLTHRSVMVQMPTGTGKTHVLAAVVSSFLTDGKRTVWIVAHRRELVAQIEETVAKYGTSLTDGCIRVMSIQWLTRHYDDVVENRNWSSSTRRTMRRQGLIGYYGAGVRKQNFSDLPPLPVGWDVLDSQTFSTRWYARGVWRSL